METGESAIVGMIATSDGIWRSLSVFDWAVFALYCKGNFYSNPLISLLYDLETAVGAVPSQMTFSDIHCSSNTHSSKGDVQAFLGLEAG